VARGARRVNRPATRIISQCNGSDCVNDENGLNIIIMSEQHSPQRPELAGAVAAESPRASPFAHGSLPQRPNYLPEEGEVGRSDFIHLLKAVLLMLVATGALGWLLTSVR
jgi:hypothetical protein